MWWSHLMTASSSSYPPTPNTTIYYQESMCVVGLAREPAWGCLSEGIITFTHLLFSKQMLRPWTRCPSTGYRTILRDYKYYYSIFTMRSLLSLLSSLAQSGSSAKTSVPTKNSEINVKQLVKPPSFLFI